MGWKITGPYRAGLYQVCRAVPPGVLRGRPKHGPCLRAGLARARYRSGRAGLGPGQKTRPRAGLTGSGCMAIYSSILAVTNPLAHIATLLGGSVKGGGRDKEEEREDRCTNITQRKKI